MRPYQVDKYLGKKVKLTFRDYWVNEAVQCYVDTEEEPIIGILVRCKGKDQEHLYCLESEESLPTDHVCWSANRIKSIVEVLE